VSLGSFVVVILSIALFGLGAWSTLIGKLGEGDGFLMLAGCVLAGVVFAYRAQDPAWLDPVSIVKR
jgi:hypothetical protein